MKHSLLTPFAVCSLFGVLLSGCGGNTGPTNSGVYLLLDTSGTYTEELSNAQKLVNVMLVKLESNDSFAVARTDTGSDSARANITNVTFNHRARADNQQKAHFRDADDTFAMHVKPSRYTNQTAGAVQSAASHNEIHQGKTTQRIDTPLK